MLFRSKEKAEDRLAAAQEKKLTAQADKYKKLEKRNKDKAAQMQEKEDEQNRLQGAAGSLVEQLMAEKLGRAVPSYGTGAFGFDGSFGGADKKADAKKDDKKADAKKDAKKDEKKK